MSRKLLTILSIGISIAMTVVPTNAETGEPSSMQVKTENGVKSILQQQADCWNNGDLNGFMKAYLNSNETSYTSGAVDVWGFDALQKRYVDKYGSNRDSMGQLKFSDLRTIALSKESALCIGHWHLERKEQPELDGTFSLVLIKTTDGWRIIHDHTSRREPTKP